jgi:hypothetical protein
VVAGCNSGADDKAADDEAAGASASSVGLPKR